MDASANASTTRSRIPRSKLPVPTTAPGVRLSPSRDSLRASSNISVPRLRGTPSRDQLPSSTTRDRDLSNGSVNYTSSNGQIRGGNKRDNNLRKPLGRSNLDQPEHTSSPPEKATSKKLNQPQPVATAVEDEVRSSATRQSLSERTMETLAQLPPSPAVRRRRSSFFNPESPMRPPSRATNGSRPGSRHQADTSMPPPTRITTSRPSSSSGYRGDAVPIDFRASTNSFGPRNSSFTPELPVNHSQVTKPLKTPLKTRSNVNLRASATPSKLPPPFSATNIKEKSPTTIKKGASIASRKSGSATVAHRPLKPRASVGGLFRKPSMPDLDPRGDKVGLGPTKILSSTSKPPEVMSMASRPPAKTAKAVQGATDESVTPRKTSLALREQIAKAKAAKRAQNVRQSSGSSSVNPSEESSVIPAGTFDFGLSEDPFNQQVTLDGMKGLLRKRIDAARTDGRLNIAAMGLKEIPVEVMNMYNFDAISNQGGSWAECVDLTRFVAADNELEELSDDIFPDIGPHELLSDEDSKGNQFGGLETLDLHGNFLKSLPVGFRRLNLLTTLNLSNNKLEDSCFAVISQMLCLRDLKLSSNNLSGELSASICKLENLELLDVQRNSLTSLPDGLAELIRLRVLNVSENGFRSLPFETLHRLPLMELLAKKNKLDGTLIAMHDVEFPQLQVLDVSVNALTCLSSDEVRLPALHQLSCSSNRLTSLPTMASWRSLLTLAAEDNNISSIPEGFVTLPKVKNVDLTGNNLKTLDDEIGRMESLDIFRISGNPLREKKFSSMSVEDLKRALSARLAPLETDIAQEDASEIYASCPSSPTHPNSSHWSVKPGGVLDRSNTQSYSLNPVIAAQVSAAHDIRLLDLRHNLFKEIPSAIEFFAPSLTTLILSHNELTSDTFLKDPLDLPALKELNLSSNTFSSLHPLTQHLRAPALEKLDINFNRLTSLLPLRQAFPLLTVLLASNNAIHELHPDSVRGLKVLDCSSNDIAALNARIGLLGGPGGLERLDVSGNRFRVPKYTVLEKGTEATLAWLRDRIPAGEGVGVGDVD